MATRGQPVLNVYPVGNYTFGTKPAKVEKDANVNDRLARLKSNFEKEGIRRSVEALLLVQEHNHPHVLIFQLGPNYFRLPGGRLRPGEDEVEGLRRKLSNNLAPTNQSLQVVWDVGEVLSVFYRPNFDTAFYPYVPTHVTRPKEARKLFVVQLPERCVFAVPKNMKLVAVPLFDLYDNAPRYGPVMAAIPAAASRLRLNLQATLPPPPPIGGMQPPPMPGQGGLPQGQQIPNMMQMQQGLQQGQGPGHFGGPGPQGQPPFMPLPPPPQQHHPGNGFGQPFGQAEQQHFPP